MDRIVTNIMTAPWIHKPDNPTGALSKQMLGENPANGMHFAHTIYEPGTYAPKHRHSCGHGIYVLGGLLKTDTGIYGPGTFIWYPAGDVMEHGATPELPVEVLFFTDGPFDIEFLES